MDIGGSIFILALTAPLILFIALWIKLDSPGPVLFRHVRIGQDRRGAGDRRGDPPAAYAGSERRTQDLFGRPFVLYKFRTMYWDARVRFPDLYRYDYTEEQLASLPIKVLVGLGQAQKGSNGRRISEHGFSDDPRVTRAGKWLRRASLDELPNFVNVLRGDMHLVGPRPDMYENIRYYPPEHREKLRVKPGITGLAQIRGRGNLPFLETNEHDLEYLRTRSLLGDVRIILKTIRTTLTADGAY